MSRERVPFGSLPGIIHRTESDGRKVNFLNGLLHDWGNHWVILPGFETWIDDKRGWEDSQEDYDTPDKSSNRSFSLWPAIKKKNIENV